MFSKKYRLARTKDVKMAFAQGRSFFNPFFVIKYLGKLALPSRFTVVVSTKTAKKAVDRNRIKRVLREFVRLRIKRFKNGDYVIIVKSKVFKEKESFVLKQFEQLLTSTKLMENAE